MDLTFCFNSNNYTRLTSQLLQNNSRSSAHSVTDAGESLVPWVEVVHKMSHQTTTGHADRVTQRDRT